MISHSDSYSRSVFTRKYFWLFLGRLLPLFSLFGITVLYSRRLGYAAYGAYQSVWMYANIVNVVVSFGFSSVLLSANLPYFLRFLRDHRRRLVSFYTVLSILTFGAFFLLAKNFSGGLKLLLIAFMVVQNVITVAETILLKKHGEVVSFVINLVYAALFFGCHVFILLTHYSLSTLMTCLIVLSVAKLAAVIMVPVRGAPEEARAEDEQMVQHWVYMGLTEILGVVSRWIDKIFLLYLLTAADFAIFFNGSFEIPFFGLLISVAGSLMMIEFSRNPGDTSRIISGFRETSDLLSSVVFPLFFFLYFMRGDLFSIVFNNRYQASVPVFAISIFILPLRINNYGAILQCFSKGNRILTGAVLDIGIALGAMAVFYPLMGSRGIVLSIVLSTYLQSLYYLWHSARLLQTGITTLMPFGRLIPKFLVLFALFFSYSRLSAGLPAGTRVLIASILAAGAMVGGLWRYVRSFLSGSMQ